jgi:D-alanyl-D-alanine dipeptidase
VNATPRATAGGVFHSRCEPLTDEARGWRDVLSSALSDAGVVNYPPEWWQWSFGDRYWAAVTDAPNAIYAPR